MKSRFSAFFCLVPFALCLSLSAQQPTFRAGVTLVTTDVIVRNDRGQFVADLTKDNFSILEDGQPQKIESFSMVQGGRTFTLLTPTATPVPEGLVLPRSKPRSADTTGRVLLILVDDLHFEAELTPHVRRLLQTIIDTMVHEGDLVSVVSTGPSFIEVGPTYDRKLLAEAANKIRGSGYTPSDIFNMMETSQGPGDMRNRAQLAFHTAYNILTQLENVANRRKAVLFISTGYDFDPFAEGRASKDRVMGGRFGNPIEKLIDEDNPYFSLGRATADIDLFRLTRELTLSANRANASIFTIDPRGLAGITDVGHSVDQSSWRTYIQKTVSTLRYLADETGGFAIVNTNDFASELKRVDAETSDYYVLGFYSTNADPTKRTRQLEVKVDRPGVTVQSRRAYSLRTEGTPPAPPPLKKK
ncbi:MAG TPA: VWA domain-containing protein [Vicinamibacterales bacterium]|nr:VWA domain-containing protein [Vicinamibacterales bacterium]